jgi:hypothetical protein
VLAYQLRSAQPLGADEPALTVRTDAELNLVALAQRLRLAA